jgi:ankyrin repeat protein
MNFKRWLLLTEAKKASDIAKELLGNNDVLIGQIKSIIPKNIPEKLQGQLLPIAAFYHKQQLNLNILKQDMQDYSDLLKNQKIQMITVKDDLTIDGDFKSYLHWTEIIHGKKHEDKVLNAPVQGDVSDQEIIAQSTDGKIKVYKANSMNQCIVLGKGEKFCISQPANPMFQSYRNTKTSTFYFVYDNTRINDLDDLKIVVVDATEHGIELTDRKNQTAQLMQDPYETTPKRIKSNPDLYFKYLQEKGIDTTIFKNIPKSPEEEVEQEKLGKKNGSLIWFKSLTPEEKSSYIGRGHNLSNEQFDYIYDNNFTLLLKQYVKTGAKIPDYQIEKISVKKDLRDNYLHNRIIQNQNYNDLSKQEYALFNPKQKEEFYNSAKDSKVNRAIELDDIELAKEFVENGEKIGDAIFSAAYKGNFDIVKYFIKKGANLDDSSYVVNAAAYSGNVELVKYFTNEKGIFDENGIKINNGMEIDDNAVPSAASNGKIAMIKYLVEERNMKIDDRCINNAAAGNHFDIIKYLLGDEVRDEQGNVYKLPKEKIKKIGYSTDIMPTAIGHGSFEMVKYLAEKGAVGGINEAIANGKLEIVKYLFGKGQHPDVYALVDAAKNGHLEVLRYLMNEKNIKIADHAVDKAAEQGRFDVVKYLVGEKKLPSYLFDREYDNTISKASTQEIKDYLIQHRQEAKVKYHSSKGRST